MLFFDVSIHQRILKKIIVMDSIKILGSTSVFNIDNNNTFSWAGNQYIRIIFDGSCDTECCSNDAENSAFLSKE